MSPISAMPPVMPAFDVQKHLDALPAEARIGGIRPSIDGIKGIEPGQTQESFGSLFGRLVSDVSAKQSAAGDAVAALQSGQNIPLHQAVIAMEEASVSFQLMVEVRNKLMEAYQEIMRMQV
jgi:flagellar hook-basal body complex protein FliE